MHTYFAALKLIQLNDVAHNKRCLEVILRISYLENIETKCPLSCSLVGMDIMSTAASTAASDAAALVSNVAMLAAPEPPVAHGGQPASASSLQEIQALQTAAAAASVAAAAAAAVNAPQEHNGGSLMINENGTEAHQHHQMVRRVISCILRDKVNCGLGFKFFFGEFL